MKRKILSTAVTWCTALACASVLLSGCDGPAGVELGTNWAGAQSFVLVKVDGLTTVVGVDPVKHSSDALAVVPTQSDDDTIRSPQIVRLSDGRWTVSTPKTGKPSQLYEIDTKGHSLERVGTVEAEHALVAVGGSVAAVGSATASTSGKAEAMVYDPQTWNSGEVIALPVDPGLAAGSSDALCVANAGDTSSTVVEASLKAGPKPTSTTVPGLQIQALSCAAGSPDAAGGPGSGTPATGGATVKLTKVGRVTVVSAAAGRVDRIIGAKDTITVAVALPEGVELITLRRGDGTEAQRVSIKGLAGVTGLQKIATGWVITSGDQAVAVTDAGKTDTFSLPGELLSAD